MRARSIWRWGALVLVVSLAGLIHVFQVSQSAMRGAFMGTTHILAMALRSFAWDNEGQFPETWTQFVVETDDSNRTFLLPPWIQDPPTSDDIDSWAYYTLVPGRKESDPSGTVVAFAPYKDQGGCVIYTQGWAEWKDAAEYQRKVSELISQAPVTETAR